MGNNGGNCIGCFVVLVEILDMFNKNTEISLREKIKTDHLLSHWGDPLTLSTLTPHTPGFT